MANLFEGFPFWNTSEAGQGNPVRQGGEMSAAQIAFDMEVGEAFEYRENEYREKRKALVVKAVEERAANPPTLKRYDLMVRHLVLSVCATQCPCARDRC